MIGQQTIDRVRREARIVEIIGERVKLVRRGRTHFGLCPFHKEKTPSFHVNPERGFYHCFGCSASGDAIKFLGELEGLSFVEAVRKIAERQGIEIVETGSEEERRQDAEARRRRDDLFRTNEEAAAFFERMLKTHPLAPIAVREIERRGLSTSEADSTVSEALRVFRLGYAPYGWDGLSRHLREHQFSVHAAEQLGLLVPRKSGPGFYDRFRHRLMFGVLDQDGRVIAFSGRALSEPTTAELGAAGLESMGTTGDPPAKYVNSPESPIYKKRETVFGLHQARRALRDEDCAILVEGNFDVVSLHARGICNVVAPLGTAFTAEQGHKIRRLSQNVVLMFDADDAGRRAVRHARDACRDAGLTVKVATLPNGMDPDEMARQNGADAIRRIVTNSKSLLEHLIASTLDRGFAAADAHGRSAKIREVAELIASEADPTARAMAERHADSIAERLGIADVRTFRALASVVHRAVAEGEGRVGTNRDVTRAEPPERARSRERRGEIALEILGALLDFPALLESAEVLDAIGATAGGVATAIAALRHSTLEEVNENPELLLAKLPAPIHSFAAARLAAPRHETVDDARSELLRNVEKLKRLELSRQTSEVMEELERLQSVGEFDRELTLLREHARRARERHGLER